MLFHLWRCCRNMDHLTQILDRTEKARDEQEIWRVYEAAGFNGASTPGR